MDRDFLLEDLGELAPHQNFVLSSCDVGVRKPNPRELISLMKHFGQNSEQGFYVGNEEKDIRCAINAKVKSVLLINQGFKDYGQTYSVNKLSDTITESFYKVP